MLKSVFRKREFAAAVFSYNPTIRHYLPDDRTRLVELWNGAHGPLGGHRPRTDEWWSWNILARPSISVEDILVAEHRGQVLGFGVLAPRGSVIEFAVDSSIARRHRRSVCRALIRALETRARARGDDALNFFAPSTDTAVNAAFRKEGYFAEPHGCMGVGVLNAQVLVSELLKKRITEAPENGPRSYSIELSPGNYQVSPQSRLRIAVGGGQVSVDAIDAADPVESNVTISMDLGTLTELILGRRNFDQAYAERRIRVTPSASRSEARSLLALLAIDSPWYFTPADTF